MPPEAPEVNVSQRDPKRNENCRAAGSIPHGGTSIGNPEDEFPDKPTLSSLTDWASSALKSRGIDSSRLDAEVILSHLLGCRRIDLYAHPDRPVENTLAAMYQNAIRRRMLSVPLQYITNHTEFMSLDFYVDERVLIPRPETELLAEVALQKSQTMPCEDEFTLVDIGTGSGAIAITLAKKIDKAMVFAVDISADALVVARTNADRHKVLHKITLLCGDTFEPLKKYSVASKVHFIVSNPPYISSDEFPYLQKEVRDYEPYVALVSGEDGLQIFRRIIAQAKTWLMPGGYLLFEVGENQAQRVMQLIADTGCFTKPFSIKDYQNIDRIVVAQMETCCG